MGLEAVFWVFLHPSSRVTCACPCIPLALHVSQFIFLFFSFLSYKAFWSNTKYILKKKELMEYTKMKNREGEGKRRLLYMFLCIVG